MKNKPIVCLATSEQLLKKVPLLTNWVEAYNKYFKLQIKDQVLTAENVDYGLLNETYVAVLIRHKLPLQFTEQITIPIFAQHELPFISLGSYNKQFIYLSDKSYLKYYPQANEKLNLVRDNVDIPEKKYDLLFIGTFGLRSESKTKLAKTLKESSFMKRFVNDFSSLSILFEKVRRKNFVYNLVSRFRNEKYLGLTNWSLQHQVREERRNKIIDELEKLVSENVKICIITNKRGKKNIPTKLLDEAEVIYDVDYTRELSGAISDSKFVITSTPFHQSILNERFVLSLENGAIPLVEPFPQYLQFDAVSKFNLLFDYSERNFSSTFLPLSDLSETKYLEIYDQLKTQVSLKYSETQFSEKLNSLILNNNK